MSVCMCFKHCCLHAFFLIIYCFLCFSDMYVCTHACKCIWKVKANHKWYFLGALHPVFEIASPTRLQFRQSWLASESQKSSCLCIPSARTVSVLSFTLPFFCLCSRESNSSFHSCMASIYWISNLPSPPLFLKSANKIMLDEIIPI